MNVKTELIRLTLVLTTLFLIAAPATVSAAGSEGALSQKAYPDGCITNAATAGCTTGKGLDGATSVTVSPDGKSAYVASAEGDAVAVFDRDTTTGALTQKTGIDACVSETGSGGNCADGVGLDAAYSVTVSPDGNSVYVASYESDAVAVFDRDTTTGALTQKAGTDACVSETGSGGNCTDGVGLDAAHSVTVSPDGRSAYVASPASDAVAAFDRDTTTGALTQKAGTDACVSETGSGGNCTDGVGLGAPHLVTVSPDGRSAYVASTGDHAVAVFDRDTTTGALIQKTGIDACISETGTGGNCVDGVGLSGARTVTVSPDGNSAYVASREGDAVAVFDRDTTTGALTQKAGTEACISETGSFGACTDGVGLVFAYSVTVSPDGRSAYVASRDSGAVAVFDRDTTTGALTQKADPDGCIANVATAGCTTGKALAGAYSVAVSPDGKRAYVASRFSDAVAVFDRMPDTTAPDTQIESGPGGTITTEQATFTFGGHPAADTARIQCRIDSEPFADCASPKTFTGLSDGPHTAEFRAEDAAGNQDPTPATRTFNVDTIVNRAKIGKVKVNGPAKVKRRKKATYKVRITNSGDTQATEVRLKVEGRGVKAKKTVGSIAAGKTRTVKVRLKFKKPGKVRVSFKVAPKNAGGRTVKKKIRVKN